MNPPIRKKPKPATYMMRVIKGGFEPADNYTQSKLRERNYHMGDLVTCTFKKLNNPKFNRLIHYIGILCQTHIEAFHGMDAHKILKRLQIEGNIHCEAIGVVIPGIGMAEYRYPLSLDFETIDDGARHEIGRAFCRWIAERYWKDMTPEAIEDMAGSFIEEV
jgi:hypothetical protein